MYLIKMNKMRRFLIAAGVITTLVCVGWVAQTLNVWRVNATNSQFNNEVESLFVGLQKYKEYVGEYPRGSNDDIAKALKGKNPKNVIIVVGKDTQLNSKGEFVDPWETPLRIYFSQDGIMVRSAGPNKRFDDSTAANSDDFFRSN